jgi:hypothetical protein
MVVAEELVQFALLHNGSVFTNKSSNSNWRKALQQFLLHLGSALVCLISYGYICVAEENPRDAILSKLY